MTEKITDQGKNAYFQALEGDTKARSHLYVRKLKIKSGGYEYKLETTRFPFLLKILHIFTRVSTKYFYGQEALDVVKNLQEKNEISKLIKDEPLKLEELPAVPVEPSIQAEPIEEVLPPVQVEPPRLRNLPFNINLSEIKIEPLQVESSLIEETESGDFQIYDPSLLEDVVPYSEPPGIKEASNIPQGWKLETFPTVGDGSCGVHALLGEIDKKGKYRCDAVKVRQEYTEDLRAKMQDSSPLPERFLIGLTEYFLDFHNTPGKFSKNDAVRRAWEELHPANYSSLSKDEQDSLLSVWLSDGAVLNTYINYLEDSGNDLLQDELMGVGEYLNKTIYLVQKGWGNNSEMIEGLDEPVIKGIGQPVYIWYVPNIHYERATFTKIDS